jgi:uncharacterized protein
VLTAALLALGGLGAGLFGSLLGLGGGILIVPLLTLLFGYPINTAVGTSLICVIATSSGAAAEYVRTDRADVRLGLVLELTTALGGIAGGVLAGLLLEEVVAGLFAALMYYTAFAMSRTLRRPARTTSTDVTDAKAVQRPAQPLSPGAPDGPGAPPYRTHRVGAALAGSFLAGNVSGLLGVGGGIVKVPLINVVMGAPFAVAVATSNLIIGVTAAAGAFFYLFRGEIEPGVAGPVVLGVFAGAALGPRVAGRLRQSWLTWAFLLFVVYVAVQMTIRALAPALA